MSINEIYLFVIGVLGWVWAIIQFFLSRRKQDKVDNIKRRFDVYMNFLNSSNEINKNLRSDPSMVFGLTNEFIHVLKNGNEDELDNAVNKFNSNLIYTVRKSIQPTYILIQEFNKIKLVCSNDMTLMIDEFRELAISFTNDTQTLVDDLSTFQDLEITTQRLQELMADSRVIQMANLWQEIEILMRREISYD